MSHRCYVQFVPCPRMQFRSFVIYKWSTWYIGVFFVICRSRPNRLYINFVLYCLKFLRNSCVVCVVYRKILQKLCAILRHSCKMYTQICGYPRPLHVCLMEFSRLCITFKPHTWHTYNPPRWGGSGLSRGSFMLHADGGLQEEGWAQRMCTGPRSPELPLLLGVLHLGGGPLPANFNLCNVFKRNVTQP